MCKKQLKAPARAITQVAKPALQHQRGLQVVKFIFLKTLSVVLCSGLAVATFAQGSATRPQVPLPDGPLRNIILKNCVSCHGIDDYAYHALSRDNWDTFLEEQHASMPVNKLARGDRNLLLDYLAEKFGSDQEPFPRSYIPPEIDTFYGEDDGRIALDTVCTECHELDRVYETRATLERWRVLLLEMRARGAEMSDDHDLERLAEYLSRVQSANRFE